MKPDRIIDIHSHASDEDPKKCAEAFLRVAEANNIRKVVLLGLEWTNRGPGRGNRDVLACAREAPELIVPFACPHPDEPADGARVDRWREEGFRGLKFILPRVPYHHESLYPYYERAEALAMPCLFHLGIVARLEGQHPGRVDNNLMRPVYLDTIARDFPNLTLIGAHLGNPWYEEATMSCRWNPNLYFDLSGSTLKKKKPEFLQELLWWGGDTYPFYADRLGRCAWEKILFGSDVKPADIPEVIDDYLRLAEALDLGEEMVDIIFYRTAAKILQSAGVSCD